MLLDVCKACSGERGALEVAKKLEEYKGLVKETEVVPIILQEPEVEKQTPLIRITIQSFGLEDKLNEDIVQAIQRASSVQAAISDITLQIGALEDADGAGAILLPSDFTNLECWQDWRTVEIKVLEERMRVLQALPVQEAVGDRDAPASTAIATDAGLPHIHDSRFEYVPSRPRHQYLDLLRTCLDTDLSAMAEMTDADLVSLDILSQEHMLLLGECADHWRILRSTHLVAVLTSMSALYRSGDIPVECLYEALQNVKTAKEGQALGEWLSEDVSRFFRLVWNEKLILLLIDY